MIDIGVARPSAHGQAMISTATALTSAYARRGSGPSHHHSDEGQRRDAEHRRHEPRRDTIGERLDRRAAALRFGDHLHDAREHRVAAHAFGAHQEAAGAIHRAAGDGVAGRFLDRQRFAGEHGFIDV